MDSKYAYSNSCTQVKAGSLNTIHGFPVKRKADKLVEPVEDHKKLNQSLLREVEDTKFNCNKFSSKKNIQQKKDLPVYNCRYRLLKEIEKSDTLLLMSETGSGKTTQIPQFLLNSGYGKNGIIGVTQPRRVAAITIAKRVAQELNCNTGELVGYSVRFEDCTSQHTRIKYLTDGFMLREALLDRLLQKYSVLILDEAHERTVNTDVLFGIAKEAQKQRRLQKLNPLKIIITSATMDIDHFGQYFNVRGLYLEGRNYPVRVMHTTIAQPDYIHAALVTIFEFHRNTPLSHDVLVFLTGQEEIETMAKQIRQIARINSLGTTDVRVFTLYSQLPQAKQMECFLPVPANARKIILATNIAETSITIPGIRCVVDCGYVKQKVYNPMSNIELLRNVRISQAQAWQRCGRAGRDSAGICYRTYTKHEMECFDHMSKPEILRSNISSVVLQLLALGVDCKTFDFLDRPSEEALSNAYRILKLLGAIDSATNAKITELGRILSKFPLDPKFSKLLLSAPKFGCMNEILSLVAVMSSENIFINTTDHYEAASLAHAKFQSKQGDHLTFLNVYTAFEKTEKPKLWCHDNFLNVRNLNYAREVRTQLLEIIQGLNLPMNSCGDNYDTFRRCLLTGFFDNIAELQKDNQYLTLSSRQKAKIHPSSCLHGKYKPNYILYSEIISTERNFLRHVTEISPEWIEQDIPFYEHFNKIIK